MKVGPSSIPKMIFSRGSTQPSFCNAEVDWVVSLGFRVQMRRLFCVGVAKRPQTRLSELVSHMRLHVLFRFDRDSSCFWRNCAQKSDSVSPTAVFVTFVKQKVVQLPDQVEFVVKKMWIWKAFYRAEARVQYFQYPSVTINSEKKCIKWSLLAVVTCQSTSSCVLKTFSYQPHPVCPKIWNPAHSIKARMNVSQTFPKKI